MDGKDQVCEALEELGTHGAQPVGHLVLQPPEFRASHIPTTKTRSVLAEMQMAGTAILA